MTMLADRIAGSRSLFGLVLCAVAMCSVELCALEALANAATGGEVRPDDHARPADDRRGEPATRWLSAHNQRSDERFQVSAPQPPGQARNDRGIAVGLGVAAPLVALGSVKVVKASTPAALPASMPEALTFAIYNELTAAFAGFASGSAKIEIGTMADGEPRLLFVSIGGQDKQTFWWFAPPDQPEGWFDDSGRRLGNSVLAEPKPNSRISSQFGIRRYYGRISSAGFHNGIDYEGKIGEPIFAAADGVINHSGWYFEYGRTVKITHADKFETLYAHLSHFAVGIGPGSKVRKGDLVGYVGMTGRSTGPHLHFSTIVNGQFVDPQPFISGNRNLRPDALVLFRKWQRDVRAAAEAEKSEPDHPRLHNLKTDDDWTMRI